MSRHGRQDFSEAIHLIRVEGARGGACIFFDAVELRAFGQNAQERPPNLCYWEHLLGRACDRNDVQVHAYEWLPNAAIVLLQRHAVPLDVILASVLGQFSRYLHRSGRLPEHQSAYRARYESIVVAPEWLLYAVRHVYWNAVHLRLCRSPIEYPFCSYALHCAQSTPRWFRQADFLAGIQQRGYAGRTGCEQFLLKRESQRHLAQFSLSRGGARIMGEHVDVENVLWQANNPRPTPSLEHILESVSVLMKVEPASEDDSVLRKAVTTWYATRSGAATLEDMGRWFRRSPTTLRRDIESRRANRPDLFGHTIEELLALSSDRDQNSAESNTRSGTETGRTPFVAQRSSAFSSGSRCTISNDQEGSAPESPTEPAEDIRRGKLPRRRGFNS